MNKNKRIERIGTSMLPTLGRYNIKNEEICLSF